MTHHQHALIISTARQGLYEITNEATIFINETGNMTGLLTLFVQHTSCPLTIQENADPDVMADLNEFFARLVPEGMEWLRHTAEGPDDMPAHIKAALNNVSLSVPVANGRPVLGTWQGIYLFEHRRTPHQRRVVMHLSD